MIILKSYEHKNQSDIKEMKQAKCLKWSTCSILGISGIFLIESTILNFLSSLFVRKVIKQKFFMISLSYKYNTNDVKDTGETLILLNIGDKLLHIFLYFLDILKSLAFTPLH